MHLHFVSPDTHLKTISHTHISPHAVHSRTHAKLGSAAHSAHKDRGVSVILKTLIRRFSSAKSQVFRESGVSWKVLTASPKPLAWIRERERKTVGMVQGRAEGAVGGAYFSRSGVLTFGHC